jgi:predicted oxidoreductase
MWRLSGVAEMSMFPIVGRSDCRGTLNAVAVPAQVTDSSVVHGTREGIFEPFTESLQEAQTYADAVP